MPENKTSLSEDKVEEMVKDVAHEVITDMVREEVDGIAEEVFRAAVARSRDEFYHDHDFSMAIQAGRKIGQVEYELTELKQTLGPGVAPGANLINRALFVQEQVSNLQLDIHKLRQRIDAAIELGLLQSDEIVPVLMPLFEDEEQEVA